MTKTRLQAAIDAHRRDAIVHFTHEMPVSLQADSPFCEELKRECAGLSGDWSCMVAAPNLGPMLPDVPGLYMFVHRSCFQLTDGAQWVEPQNILYVGRAGIDGGGSGTLRKRYHGAYRKMVDGDPEELWTRPFERTRDEVLRRLLTLRPLEFWYCEAKDASRLKKLERDLIHIFNPPGNTQEKPDLYFQPPEKAW